MGLFESLLQLAATGEDVLFVSYDIEARGPLAGVAPSQGLLASSLVLAARPGEHSVARIDWDFVHGAQAVASAARPANAALVAGNSNEPCLPLFEALASGEESEVISVVSPGLALRLRVAPPRP